jgi:hypothetical protein
MPELIHGEFVFPSGIAECFNSHVEADLVSILEAICDSLGHAVDSDINTFNAMILYAFG